MAKIADYRPRHVRKWAYEQMTRDLEGTKLAEAREQVSDG